MSRLSATYYDGRSSRTQSVRLSAPDAKSLLIEGADWQRHEAREAVRITSRLAGIHRTLTLRDGGQVQVQDNAVVDAWFPQRHRMEAFVERLERHASAVAASLLIVVASAYAFFAYGLPMLAQRAAEAMPPEIERRMGEETLGLLGHAGFAASTLPLERQEQLGRAFADYVADLPEAKPLNLQLHLLSGGVPNAFALPGGAIVVDDRLLEVLGNDEQFLAVVAHEIGHQVHRHALRSVLQSSGVVVVTALFTGDVASASAVVVSLPAFLLDSHYSRAFESEADDYAYASLAAHGISPIRFVEALSALFKAGRVSLDDSPGYLSSHPPTAERIRLAREAAQRFERTAHSQPSPEPRSGK